MTDKPDAVVALLNHPKELGREIGFSDLTPLHGSWIRHMVFGRGDYTLQAHRGSYKSSCLAVAISILLVIYYNLDSLFVLDYRCVLNMTGTFSNNSQLRQTVRTESEEEKEGYRFVALSAKEQKMKLRPYHREAGLDHYCLCWIILVSALSVLMEWRNGKRRNTIIRYAQSCRCVWFTYTLCAWYNTGATP